MAPREDAIHHLAMDSPPDAASSDFWQQGRDPGPRFVGELTLLDHRLRLPHLVAVLDEEKLG